MGFLDKLSKLVTPKPVDPAKAEADRLARLGKINNQIEETEAKARLAKAEFQLAQAKHQTQGLPKPRNPYADIADFWVPPAFQKKK